MSRKVMIYGGSGGMGAATARRLRARGNELHLVGRHAGKLAAITGMHPLPRLGTSDDMAALATFLLSQEADWITGQIIGVDGGRSRLRTKN